MRAGHFGDQVCFYRDRSSQWFQADIAVAPYLDSAEQDQVSADINSGWIQDFQAPD